MKLSTKGRYAVTALLDIAMQGEDAVVSLSDIAERQEISISYLEQLFLKLKKHGLVSSVRGANGGYSISKNPLQINMLDIINAVEENVEVTRCDNHANCQAGSKCITHDLWFGLTQHISEYLTQITLADLIKQHQTTSQNLVVSS